MPPHRRSLHCVDDPVPAGNFAIELEVSFNFNTLFAGGSTDAACTLALLFFLFFGTVGAGDADIDVRAFTGAGCEIFCFFAGGPPDEVGLGGGDIALPGLREMEGVDGLLLAACPLTWRLLPLLCCKAAGLGPLAPVGHRPSLSLLIFRTTNRLGRVTTGVAGAVDGARGAGADSGAGVEGTIVCAGTAAAAFGAGGTTFAGVGSILMFDGTGAGGADGTIFGGLVGFNDIVGVGG